MDSFWLWVLQLSFFASLPSIHGLGVLFPIYFDPGRSCQSWSGIVSAINAHPNTTYYSVINPDDGPGANGTQPDGTYQGCVKSLRPAGKKGIVLGYIDTATATLPMSEIQDQINTYASWDASYRPDGIFFDGATSSASMVETYSKYASYARGKGFNFIALDPGEVTDPGYYAFSDLINVYESSYTRFSTSSDIVVTNSMPASKQSLILTNTPTSTTSFKPLLSQLAKQGIGAVYATDLDDSESGVPKQWSLFTNDVAEVNASGAGNGTAASSSSSVSVSSTFSSTSSVSETSSVSSTPSAEAVTSSPSDSGSNTGAIVGGVLGALAALVIIGVVAFILRRNRRRRQELLENPSYPYTDEDTVVTSKHTSHNLPHKSSMIKEKRSFPGFNGTVPPSSAPFLNVNIPGDDSESDVAVTAFSPYTNSTAEERSTREAQPAAPSSWGGYGVGSRESEERTTRWILNNPASTTGDDVRSNAATEGNGSRYGRGSEKMDPPPVYSPS